MKLAKGISSDIGHQIWLFEIIYGLVHLKKSVRIQHQFHWVQFCI